MNLLPENLTLIEPYVEDVDDDLQHIKLRLSTLTDEELIDVDNLLLKNDKAALKKDPLFGEETIYQVPLLGPDGSEIVKPIGDDMWPLLEPQTINPVLKKIVASGAALIAVGALTQATTVEVANLTPDVTVKHSMRLPTGLHNSLYLPGVDISGAASNVLDMLEELTTAGSITQGMLRPLKVHGLAVRVQAQSKDRRKKENRGFDPPEPSM